MWRAIKTNSKVFVHRHHECLETHNFEKGTRISMASGDNGQELHVESKMDNEFLQSQPVIFRSSNF